MASRNILHHTKAALLRFTPAQIADFQMHRRTMLHFADRYNLVYFGYVDQRDDDHRLIRGLTVSPTHRDDHYCIGTYNGYDIMATERRDSLVAPNKPVHEHRWVIMQIDLKTPVDIPHTFIGLHSHSQTFYATLFMKFRDLNRLHLGTFGAYDATFLNRYAIYAPADEQLVVERLFDQGMTTMIAKHFGTLTIEVADSALYIYAEHHRLTLTLLETMLKNSIWLARYIDERASVQNTPLELSGVSV